jgi:hypothetical protein
MNKVRPTRPVDMTNQASALTNANNKAVGTSNLYLKIGAASPPSIWRQAERGLSLLQTERN